MSPREVLRLPDRCSEAILAQDFCEKGPILAKSEERELEKKESSKAATSIRAASLRSENDETKTRRGNDAPWKAWKTQKTKASFPLFPPGLEIRPKPKAPDSHISTAPAACLYQQGKTKMKLRSDSS